MFLCVVFPTNRECYKVLDMQFKRKFDKVIHSITDEKNDKFWVEEVSDWRSKGSYYGGVWERIK